LKITWDRRRWARRVFYFRRGRKRWRLLRRKVVKVKPLVGNMGLVVGGLLLKKKVRAERLVSKATKEVTVRVEEVKLIT
jgi:hypothetical protein